MLHWWNRLSFRLLVLTVLVALVPLLGFGVAATSAGADALTREAGRANQEVANRVVEQVEALVSSLQGNLVAVADTSAFHRMEHEEQEHTLQSLLRLFPEIRSLAVLDSSGLEQIKISRDRVYLAGDLINRAGDPAFDRAIGGQPYLGPVHTSPEGIPLMIVAVPILGAAHDRAVGALVAEVSLRGLLSQVAALEVGQTGYVFIVDERGTVIAHPDLSLVLAGEDFSDKPLVKDFLTRGPHVDVHRYPNSDGVEVLGVGTASQKLGWMVVVEQPVAEALATSNAMTWGLTLALAATLLLAAAVAGYFALRLTRPLRELERGAELIGSGRLDHVIPVTSRDEVGRVTTAFNTMAARLRELTGQLRATIEQLLTPAISLREGILAMPLVGAIDTARARQITDTLLQEIVRQRARVVILDISGVPTVDTAVVKHLSDTISAARLLGVRVIVSGISPRVALTLVELGVTWGDVLTVHTMGQAMEAVEEVKHKA